MEIVDAHEAVAPDPPCDMAWVIVFCLLMPMHALLLGWIACRYSPTSDEVAHLAAGVRIWQLGDYSTYTVNPPLVKMWAALPVMWCGPKTDWKRHSNNPADRREWNVGQDFLYANVPQSLWYVTLARWACIPFSLLGLAYCDRWGRELWGRWGGVAAATAWGFSPDVLGNGALITPDVASASLGIATLFHFRVWCLKGRWTDAFLTGAMLGPALLVKLSWLLLFGLLPALAILDVLLAGDLRRRFRLRFIMQGALIGVLGIYILNVGYGYQNIGRPLGRFEFVSNSLKGSDEPTGNRFRGTVIGAIPLPVPADWITGIDLQKRDFEQGWRPMESYLRGERRIGGWRYYYLYAAAVKTPIGLLALTALSCWTIAYVRRERGPELRREIVLLLFVPAALFVFISMQTGFSRYYRYVLPCLPFAMVACGSVWDVAGRRRGTRRLSTLGGVCLAAAIGESLWFTPHQLGFYNVVAGGPESGHRHLLDSNTDWGQDLYELKDWTHAHPDARPLYLAYAGVIDPNLFDLRHKAVPVSPSGDVPDLAPGWYAVSVNHVHDYDNREPRYGYFQRLHPVDRAGYSILIYHISQPHKGNR